MKFDSQKHSNSMFNSDSSQLVTDPAFLHSVLQNLPGVDPNSDAVKAALADKDDEKKEDSEKDKQ